MSKRARGACARTSRLCAHTCARARSCAPLRACTPKSPSKRRRHPKEPRDTHSRNIDFHRFLGLEGRFLLYKPNVLLLCKPRRAYPTRPLKPPKTMGVWPRLKGKEMRGRTKKTKAERRSKKKGKNIHVNSSFSM